MGQMVFAGSKNLNRQPSSCWNMWSDGGEQCAQVHSHSSQQQNRIHLSYISNKCDSDSHVLKIYKTMIRPVVTYSSQT